MLFLGMADGGISILRLNQSLLLIQALGILGEARPAGQSKIV